MLKFLRRYQKWMLVVFCSGLMVAFVVPQALQQFSPRPGKRTIATIYDGEKITLNELRGAQADLEYLSSWGRSSEQGVSPFTIALSTLIPEADGEAERALAWLLMLKAAEKEGILISGNEAYSLLTALFPDIEDEDTLEVEAAKQGSTSARMLKVASDYLAAEQYRQLVAGVEYRSKEGQSASAGLARVQRVGDQDNQPRDYPFSRIMAIQQDLMTIGGVNALMAGQQTQRQALFLGRLAVLFDIDGYPRISAPLMVNAVQSQFASVAGQAVVLDTEPFRIGQAPDPERMAELFEKYKDADPGTGGAMGFGYRIPDRAMVEAIYIPIEPVRALARAEITEEQVGEELRRNRAAYNTWQPPEPEAEEEAAPGTETEGDTTEAGQPDGSDSTGEADDSSDAAGDAADADTGDAPAEADGPGPNPGAPPQDPEDTGEPTPEDEATNEDAEGEINEGEAAPQVEESEGAEPVEGEAEEETEIETEPPPTTISNDPIKMMQVRAEIRKTLIERRANELVREMAAAVRDEMRAELLNFKDVGGYRELPDDFEPIALQTVADRVAQRFSTETVQIELQVIPASDRWIDEAVVMEVIEKVRARLTTLETRDLLVVREMGRYRYEPVPTQALVGEPNAIDPAVPEDEPADDTGEGVDTPETESEGEADEAETEEDKPAPPVEAWEALITSSINLGQQRQPIPFLGYLSTAKELRDQGDLGQGVTGLQIGVPSEIFNDSVGSAYVFRMTEADPSHPPASQDEVQEQLEKDAITAQAYDELLATQDSLLASAREGNLFTIVPEGGTVQDIGPFTPISQPMIQGIDNPGPAVSGMLDLVDQLREQDNLTTATEAERLTVIELPGEQKLVVFKLSAYRPLSQGRYENEAGKDWVASLAYARAMPTEAAELRPLTFEALKRQTGFVPTEDYTLEDEEEQVGEAEQEGSE